MVHPAAQAVERYYSLFNKKDWPGIAAMFDVPVTLFVGSRRRQVETRDAVIALFRGLGERIAQEGAVRISWDRGSFSVFQVHDDLAIVKAVLTRETANRSPIKTWNCSYTLRLVGEDWLFVLMTSDDEGNVQAASS